MLVTRVHRRSGFGMPGRNCCFAALTVFCSVIMSCGAGKQLVLDEVYSASTLPVPSDTEALLVIFKKSPGKSFNATDRWEVSVNGTKRGIVYENTYITVLTNTVSQHIELEPAEDNHLTSFLGSVVETSDTTAKKYFLTTDTLRPRQTYYIRFEENLFRRASEVGVFSGVAAAKQGERKTYDLGVISAGDAQALLAGARTTLIEKAD